MPRGPLNLPLLIDDVTRTNLLQALEPVRGCLKTTSMLWMQALGLPVLSGVVVDDWSDDSAGAVSKFCNRNRLSSVLLRIDKRHDRWTRRRGGYIVPLSDLRRTVEELKKEEMLALLLEPASPYRDQYSLAGVTIPDEGKLIVEIVGSGFDVSDILRSDIQPHERWEIAIDDQELHKSKNPVSPIQTALVTPEQYRESVQIRLAKIGARSKNPAFPEMEQREHHEEFADLIQKGTAFLNDARETLLLRYAEEYAPVPVKHLVVFARYVGELISGLSEYGIHLGPSSFAASVILKHGLIFWDFFPARKQEAASLYPAA